jgi:DNA-binding transcriptional LysR family regulator
MSHTLQGNLEGLLVFAAVVEAGSFTAAAERMGKTKAGISAQIGRLEARLGVSLFARTTRRMRLTPAGEALHGDAAPILQQLGTALSAAGKQHTGLAGSLRITAPVDHVMQSLAPALAEFAQLHPALQFELHTGDRVVDLIAEGMDLAIRGGSLRNSSLRAIKLGEFEQHVVASPAYLKAHGVPKKPEELSHHQWISFTLLRSPLTWVFARGKETQSVRTTARLRVDSSVALRSLLISGAGISILDSNSVAEVIRAGWLVRVLTDWSILKGGYYAVLPPGRHVPANVRAFIEFYREYMARESGRGNTKQLQSRTRKLTK